MTAAPAGGAIALLPDLIYQGGEFRSDLALELDTTTGRIVRIAPPRGEVQRLPGRALMPGFVNAHSHAFQRLIRGRMQWRPDDASVSNFWSWRAAMYGAALSLDPDDVYAVSRWCFLEMLRGGITTVGEFHYLHNAPDGSAYADRAELAKRVIAAARDVGIRIVLLNTCYATGGIDRALEPEQRRFDTGDVDTFLDMTGSLAAWSASMDGVTVGVAPHSVRAVPREWLPQLHGWAAARDMPFHMHVSEQPAEIDASVAAYGMRPVEMLAEDGLLDDRFTGVHATHITDNEVRMLAESGATVCACPTTERDLGDGFLRGRDLLTAGGRIALGTDSQTMLDMLEDARLVEYNERLRRLERVVITARRDTSLESAPVLLDMATRAGANALRVNAGVLAEGAFADMIAIDLAHPVLAGWNASSLSAMLAFSGSPDVVRDVWVGGRRVVSERRHSAHEDAARAFADVARRTA